MDDLFFQKLKEKIDLSVTEYDVLKQLFIPKRILKRQYLIQEGDIAKYLAFLTKGTLRLFTIDAKGNDISIQFAIEGWWITDNYSFLTGESTMYNIEALEDSEVLLLNRNDYERAFELVPKYERFIRILLQNNFIASQRRLIASISQSAEERYLNFINTYPLLMQRIPQHMIASYLGITPETLSRVRKQLVKS